MLNAKKICLQCGEQLADSTLFCPKCGTKYEAPPVIKETKLVKAVLLRKVVYTIEEAANALGISPRFVSRLIAEGEITVCRQGRKVGITEWALEEYAKSKEVYNDNAMRRELKILSN